MKLRIKKRLVNDTLFGLFSIVIALFLFAGTSFLTESTFAVNQTNDTVLARVNVSNQAPTIYNVFVADSTPIDLVAGGIQTVTCNASFTDQNGFDDVTRVEGTLYHDSVSSSDAESNVTLYRNSTCLASGSSCVQIEGSGGNNGTCSCQFDVQYFAINGSWRCNVTIADTVLNDTENSTTFTINEVLGISLNSTILDYGSLSVTETSQLVPINVTNIGNVPINVTLRGFGGDNESLGINNTMLCEAGANISFGNQRFSLNNDAAFASMLNLSNQTTFIPNLGIPRRVTDETLGNSSNSTYWRLQVPLGPSGICNGTIIYGAVQDFTSF